MIRRSWPRRLVGLLALLGGLAQLAGLLLVTVLGNLTILLNFGLAPLLMAGLVLALGTSAGGGRLSRPGVVICVLGLVAYTTQWAALLLLGDVEGGMATPRQSLLQLTWWVAGLIAGGLLLLGGAVVLGSRRMSWAETDEA